MRDDDLRLADLLAALSVTTDLGMGQEPEKAVRGCLAATCLARAMDLPEAEVRDVFWTTLLQHVGCTAPAHETSYLFGDDLTVAVQAERTDSASLRETLALLATVGRGTGVDRPRHLARMIAAGKDGSRGIARAVCEVGDLMAERLALGAGVRLGLRHSMERWDGKGDAYRLAGDDIALPARVSVVATQAVIFDRLGGPDAAVEMARRRAGGWFDPAVADRFARVGAGVLGRLAAPDVWAEVLEAEPRPVRRIPRERADPLPVHGPRAPGPGRRDAPRAPGRLRLPPRRLRGPAPHPGPAPGRRRRLPGHDPGPPLPPGPGPGRGGPGAGGRDPGRPPRPRVRPGRPPGGRPAPLPLPEPWPAGLSDREVEVLRLVAHGLSNRQIADTLVISPRTAEHHVQHLYTKIGASTRAAAAMFAMEHGLLR